MLDKEEIAAECALNTVFGYRPRMGKGLMERMGSAKAVFGAGEDELRRVIGPYQQYLSRLTRKTLDSAAAEIESLHADGNDFVCISDPRYPLF
jgi:predicted Rossmann fold nucleotide-binding protein DprA/Smf involved in DNA uptake